METSAWLSVLEGPNYTWDYRGPPATSEQIDALGHFARRLLPADYVAFLRMCDGAAVWHDDYWFLNVWPTGEVPAVTAGYRFDEHMPGALPFASDGAGEALVFDMRREHPDEEYPVLLVNYVTVGWDETIPVATSFRELLLLDKSLFHRVDHQVERG